MMIITTTTSVIINTSLTSSPRHGCQSSSEGKVVEALLCDRMHVSSRLVVVLRGGADGPGVRKRGSAAVGIII